MNGSVFDARAEARTLQYVGEPDLTGPADIPDSLAEAASVPTTSLFHGRPRYVSEAELEEAATRFVSALGSANADLLIRNLRHTTRDSDALKALKDALEMDAGWRATRPDTAPVRWGQE